MSEIEKKAEQIAGQPPLEIEFEYSVDYYTAMGKWNHNKLMAWKGAAAVIELITERMPEPQTPINDSYQNKYLCEGFNVALSEVAAVIDTIK